MGDKKKDRQYYVVKSNDLIRKSRYNLTTQQQKIVLFCISKIKPNDSYEKWYEIEIEDICNACNLKVGNGGYYYKSIKDDLQKLTNRLWVKMPDNSETTVAWISDATIIPLSGKVYVKFHPKMAPYLFDLRERYTQYHLEDVLVFKNKYAIRLYEILRSYMTHYEIEEGVSKEISISVDEMRSMLSIDGYTNFKDFNKYVLKRAVDEINAYNEDLSITYKTISPYRRKVETIIFFITYPRARDLYVIRRNKEERLK